MDMHHSHLLSGLPSAAVSRLNRDWRMSAVSVVILRHIEVMAAKGCPIIANEIHSCHGCLITHPIALVDVSDGSAQVGPLSTRAGPLEANQPQRGIWRGVGGREGMRSAAPAPATLAM